MLVVMTLGGMGLGWWNLIPSIRAQTMLVTDFRSLHHHF